MKTLLALLIVSSCVDAASTNSAKQAQPAPAEKTGEMPKHLETKNKEPNALDKKEEDCDTKAKTPVEIKPESISLSGTTGCSLDEDKP